MGNMGLHLFFMDILCIMVQYSYQQLPYSLGLMLGFV